MKDVVIIPTYNEGANIEEIITLVFKHVPQINVLVVDDNSPDGTAKIVKELMKKNSNLKILERKGKEGLGKAYMHAFDHVAAWPEVRTVIMMDADLSHPVERLPHMLEESKKHSVVVGSRYVSGGKTVGWELWRRVLSFGGNNYCRIVTNLPIRDCTGGFNVIHLDLLKKVDFSKMDMSGYAFIMELKYLLHKAGGKFKEIPIVFKNRVGGESKISSHIISEGLLAPWKMILKK
jgi:dolichol-phosphate mannosyltransferase